MVISIMKTTESVQSLIILNPQSNTTSVAIKGIGWNVPLKLQKGVDRYFLEDP